MADEFANTSFLGTGWAFPPEFEPGVGALMVADERDIRESLHILFQTVLGERLFQPEYGLDLEGMLFESINTTMKSLLEDRIRLSIVINEPRITLLRLSLDTTSQIVEGRVLLDIDYRINATNSRFNLVHPFYTNYGNQLSVRR
jgi:phage baseplate assembly protein W